MANPAAENAGQGEGKTARRDIRISGAVSGFREREWSKRKQRIRKRPVSVPGFPPVFPVSKAQAGGSVQEI